jgi:GNAT superfamily N-acetyltransferase
VATATSIRRLDAEDWQLYRRVRLDALKEAPYAFGSTYENEAHLDEAAWRQRMSGRVRFVAEVDGVVAGTVSAGDADSTGVAAMTAMWVDPRYRRRGVGDLLVKHLLDWARDDGYDQMVLWVTDVNADARRLYERNGFTTTGAQQEVRAGEMEHEMSRGLYRENR